MSESEPGALPRIVPRDGVRFRSFAEFYPFYLSEHADRQCRRLHFIGSTGVLMVLLHMLLGGALAWLLALPLLGYGFAWIGHFRFEHNRPATFTYPAWSLLGDWLMYWQILCRRLPL